MADAYFVWAEGYLSGLNDQYVTSGAATNLLPPNLSTEEQKGFLDRFCRQHPDAPYMQGRGAAVPRDAARAEAARGGGACRARPSPPRVRKR